MSHFSYPATRFVSWNSLFRFNFFSSLPHVWKVVPGFYSFSCRIAMISLVSAKMLPCFLWPNNNNCLSKQLPVVIRHVCLLWLRLSTTGRHTRPPTHDACFHFFPLSVGFGHTASLANGAFTIAPSILCHSQAIPSSSSYSAKPAYHN